MNREQIRKLKQSREARSFVNRENALSAVETRKRTGYPKRKTARYVGGIGWKNIAMRKDDWTVLHKYADLQQRYMTDVLHELIEPLKKQVEKGMTVL